MKNNTSNLKDILSNKKLKISIPIIQRDYAQGRLNDKATDIRNKFLDEIFNRLDNNENLFLDFVYGSIEDDKFIPIDGQQRLTTLFLLHLYFAKKENKECKYLKGFTYETRSSSIEFCEKLVVEDLDFTKDKISPDIKDSSWFMPFWENDPTVKSMLEMLDAIHDKFKNSNFYDRLENIQFSFLELKEFGLTDDLYIKMNARGKPLSEFENFKAEFEKELSQEIKAKLDNAWLDLFWGLKDSDNLSSVDKRYMAFFNRVASNFYVLNIKDTKEAKDFDFDKFNALDTLEFFSSNKNNVNNVIKILDELCEVPNCELLKNFTDTSKDITYETRANFFALSAFLINFGAQKLGGDFYKEYERITSNVARDFNIDSISNLKQAFEFINEICDKCKNEKIFELLEGFDDKQPESFKTIGFYKWQEKKKLKLMQSDTRWIDAINEAEKHWYLGSNLTFLIDFAENDVEKFKEYYKKFDEIFKEDRENFFFQRALLTKGDYLPERGNSSYFTFCNFNNNSRNKDDNWRDVFFDKEKNQILKKLLDDERNLEQIIEDFDDKSYWGYYFVKYPEILKECTHFFILAYDYTIKVLTKTVTSSYHVEYYTYALFIMLKEKYPDLSDEKLRYEWVKSDGEIPYVLIGGNKIKFIKNKENKYQWMIDDSLVGEALDPQNLSYDVLNFVEHEANKLAESIEK
ncbi:DUF262 domain-containing protein [Campylobacter showae]|uniref:DUF262 domain-containing protein n=1 Tax=Campylobacter showae TaxID=204 RepID=UPI0026F1F2A2|nr:DUF262 domain-containing protein [Campylobacter showae]